VSFTEASLGRLSRYLWFGNLAELDGSKTRRVDALCIGNRLLGCLQVGVRGWLVGPGGGSG
jgi:hypothetical protein